MRHCFQTFCGVLVVSVAILVGLVLHVSRVPSGIRILLDNTDDGVEPQQGPRLGNNALGLVLNRQQLDDYHRDGFVFVKQLLTVDEASALKDAAEYASSRNFDVMGLFASSSYKKVMFDLWRTSPEISRLTLQVLPNVAAQLLRPQQQQQQQGDGGGDRSVKPFRLLRDAYFSYAPPGTGCGWHVDDEGFFPADKESKGPTFWIALDPLKTTEGGGLAVLNRTRFNQHPESKYLSEDDCLAAIKGATCAMEEKSPECQVKMEASMFHVDMNPGDALIWDRYTFHRGVPATDEYPRRHDDHNGQHGDVVAKMRYSVRYIPFGAKANGAVHSSVKQGEVFDSPYYPQVWPSLLSHEMKAIENGLDQDIKLSTAISFLAKIMAKKYMPILFPQPPPSSQGSPS
jgi:Phytanoyl-CoA dioxygenase (PhyH)